MGKYLTMKKQIKEIWAENRVELWRIGHGTLAIALVVSAALF